MPTRMQPPCWYEVLGVSRDASAEDIKAAFHQVALRLHPDKALSNSSGNGGSAAIAADDSYLSVQQAWEVLQDVERRAAYDRQLALSATAAEVHINATVLLGEMEHEVVEGQPCRSWPCRCGGTFLLLPEDASAAAEEAAGELAVPCSTCSLHIRVLTAPAQ